MVEGGNGVKRIRLRQMLASNHRLRSSICPYVLDDDGG